MGGFRKTYGDERGELLSSGLGGETQYVPVSVSPLHSPGFWDEIHDLEPSGRRKRDRPDHIRLTIGGSPTFMRADLPQSVCAHCGTEFPKAFKKCLACGGDVRAPSEGLIIEACARARAG